MFRLASFTVSAFCPALVSVSSPRVGAVAADATAQGTVAHAFAPYIYSAPNRLPAAASAARNGSAIVAISGLAYRDS